MTIETYPSSIYVPQKGTFGLQSNTRSFTSPLSGVTKTLETPGARWLANITYDALSDAQIRELMAFLVKLRGSSGRFYYGDPFYKSPAGAASGTPLVNGASQTGTTLITDGWALGVTNILKAGDYIQLANNELKMVVADVDSNGSGQATLTIEPPIRTSPADNSAIIISSPKCVMRLIDDEQTKWQISRNVGSIQLSMIEAFV